MRFVIRTVQLPLLIGLVASCTILAAIIWYFYVQRYEVRLELPFSGDVEIYKDAEPMLKSSNVLAQFAQVRGLAPSPEIAELQSQLSRGVSRSVSISHEFQVSKASVRDLPDGLAAASLVQKFELSSRNDTGLRTIPSSIVVTASAASSEKAVRMGQIAIDFLRYVFVQRALDRNITEWQHFGSRVTDRDFGSSIADLDSKILTYETLIGSLDRQITAMTTLRDNQKVSSATAVPGVGAVQVQVAGSDFLPLDQQIVGLQAQRIKTVEGLTHTREELAKKKAFRSFGNELSSLATAEPDPLKALSQALARAEELRIETQSVPERQAADGLRSGLASTRSRYVDIETNPKQPSATRAGVGLLTALAIGAAAGIIAWMCILYLLLVWRQRFGRPNYNSTSAETSPRKEQPDLSLAS